MPALASITVADAMGTPVNHTFVPVTTDGSMAKYANRAATTPKGYETLSIEVRNPTSPQAAYRTILKGNFPTEVTVDGQIVIDHQSSFEIVINSAQLSTAQERKNHLKMLSNLLAHATLVAVHENLEPVY